MNKKIRIGLAAKARYLIAGILLVLTGRLGTVRAQTLTTLYSFGDRPDGAAPAAGLVQGSDGNFYGTTMCGGPFINKGTVFKISPDGSYTNLWLFHGPDGSLPEAALVQGSDGNFYGTTANGGTNLNYGIGYGTVFRIRVVA